MDCPWCEFSGSPRELHAHLGACHPESVTFRESGARRLYSVTCPHCGASYEQAIKPGSNSSGFLEEYALEVRLVAFDMLVNHLLVEHDDEVGQGRTGGIL
jgi:phage terminase large subunit GpA-like protein